MQCSAGGQSGGFLSPGLGLGLELFIGLFIGSLVHWFVHWFVGSLVCWLVGVRARLRPSPGVGGVLRAVPRQAKHRRGARLRGLGLAEGVGQGGGQSACSALSMSHGGDKG